MYRALVACFVLRAARPALATEVRHMPLTKGTRRALLTPSRALPFFFSIVVGPADIGVPVLGIIP
jgi:hypothetical protein